MSDKKRQSQRAKGKTYVSAIGGVSEIISIIKSKRQQNHGKSDKDKTSKKTIKVKNIQELISYLYGKYLNIGRLLNDTNIINAAKHIAQAIINYKGAYLWGDTGTGKTTLLNAFSILCDIIHKDELVIESEDVLIAGLIQAIKERNLSIRIIDNVNINKILEEHKQNTSGWGQDKAKTVIYTTVDYILSRYNAIDDFLREGDQYAGGNVDISVELIENAYKRYRTTGRDWLFFATSNFNPDLLLMNRKNELYYKHAISRLYEMCEFIEVKGIDIRITGKGKRVAHGNSLFSLDKSKAQTIKEHYGTSNNGINANSKGKNKSNEMKDQNTKHNKDESGGSSIGGLDLIDFI